jgi:quinol monooxygenase YgiN
MIRQILLPFGCILALVACATETPPEPAETTEAPEATEPASGPSLLALHLYNPASDDAHQQFLTGLGELSQAVASTGHPETRYRTWKVTGEQDGDYGYLFGSLWADRATYDAVHEHDDYTAVVTQLEDSGLEALEEEVYNRYELLNPPTTPPAPLPEAGPTFLSVHRFNLASAEAEQELVAMLEELSGAISEAGHPETQYGVWKVTGDRAGDHTYLFGSAWADRATYDTAHEHPSYKALQEKHEEAFKNLIDEQIYNKYELVQ